MKQFLIAIALLVCSSVAFGQTGTALGRVTGMHGIHETIIMDAGITVTCNQSSAPVCPQTSGTFTGPNQAVVGTMNFTTTLDGSGYSSGTGSGSGILYVTCNGGSPLGIATMTFPSTSRSYPGSSCSGVTNLNQVQFYAGVSGGGAYGYSETYTSPSQIIVNTSSPPPAPPMTSFTWGVIGDTSTSWTNAASWDTQSALPVDIAIAGTTAYTAGAYSESGKNSSTFALATPQAPTSLMSPGYLDEDQYVTTDGINVYFAQIGSGWPASVPYVMAWNISANGYYTFSSGVVPSDGTLVPSAIDYNNVAGGIAVQISGSTLAVSHTAANQIILFNKTTGATVSTMSVPSPGRMAYTPAGVLWYISGTTVTNGTITLPGLVAPLALAIDPTTLNVLVADGSTSQQVKTFSAAGTLLSTYGVLGGYTDCSPTVTKTRLWLDNTAGVGYVNQTLLVVLSDSSYWVGDPGNARILHISSAGSFIEEISFLRYLYHVVIDHTNPSRVFADALEFSVNYSIPIIPGDGGGGSWALVNNWAACVPSGYTPAQFGFSFAQVQTFPNGHTYALTSSLIGPGLQQLAELPASGSMRFSGQLFSPTAYQYEYFDHNGNLGYWKYNVGYTLQQAWNAPLTGYDGSNWPTYGTASVVASVPYTGATTTPNGFAGWGMTFPAIPTTGGYYPTYQTAVSTPGLDHHLGAVISGGTNWSWMAAPGALLINPDGLGTFNDTSGYGGHNGIAAFSEGRYILQGYDGQWGTYASQWFLYTETGTFIHQFGHGFTLPAPIDGSEYPAAAGNIWSMDTAISSDGKTIYLITSDEGYHPGAHVWVIK